MDSLFQARELHILMFPFMAQGHMIPMFDLARILAQRGLAITIATTRQNASRFEKSLSRAKDSGLSIAILELEFPSEEVGLPQGCDNSDLLSSPDQVKEFFRGISMMLERSQELFKDMSPKPDCIVSDMSLPWTASIAKMLEIPRISFQVVNCFFSLCITNLAIHKVAEKISSEGEPFVIPDLPDRIEITEATIPRWIAPNMEEITAQMMEAEMGSYGVIFNSFEELELEYVKKYKKLRNGKVWCVGPASLCNKEHLDKAQRGNKSIVDESECLKWLDSKKPRSVVYVCLGSLCNLTTPQLVELGLGLEASNKPFVWVIRGRNCVDLKKWILAEGFEERVKGRGLLIRGWAPQLLILSHRSVGGFLTHCGWNSTLEGICAGIPLITWPLSGDQFLNEKLAVQVLRIAVSLGSDEQMIWGEEEKIGVRVRRETVKSAIERVMDEEDEESEERRERVRKLGEMAKIAVEKGGSSYDNVTLFLEEIINRRRDQ